MVDLALLSFSKHGFRLYSYYGLDQNRQQQFACKSLPKEKSGGRKTRRWPIGNQIPWSWCFSHFLNTDFGCTENRKTRKEPCTMTMRVTCMESWSWNFSHFLNTDFGYIYNRKTMKSWSWYFSHFLNTDFGCTENRKNEKRSMYHDNESYGVMVMVLLLFSRDLIKATVCIACMPQYAQLCTFQKCQIYHDHDSIILMVTMVP